MVSGPRSAHILRLALAKGGELSLADLHDAGIPARHVWELAAAGSLIRVRRGLYLLPGLDCEADRRLRAVTREVRGVISHHSAAKLYGYPPGNEPPWALHLTVLAPRDPSPREDLTVHRTRWLRSADVVMRDGVHVTSAPRTLVDLAAMTKEITDDEIVDLFDHLISRRLVTVPQLRAYLEQAPRLHGLGRAKRMLMQIVGNSEVESAAERRLLRLLAAHSLPRPRTQFVLHDDHGRFVARLDIAWPQQKLAVEVDGYRYHSGTHAFKSDRERGNRILAEGWTLYRTTPGDIAAGAPTLVGDLVRRLGPKGGERIVKTTDLASDSSR